MNEQLRRRDPHEWTTVDGSNAEGGGDALAAAREAGERFLRAADRAIDRALSGNSEAFLRATRQEGGQ